MSTIRYFSTAIIITLMGVLAMLIIFAFTALPAQAAGIIPVEPGQTVEFEASYEQVGDRDFEDGILVLNIGSEFIVDVNSFEDNYNRRGNRAISSSLVGPGTGGWGTQLRYLPGSANSTAPAGIGTPGQIIAGVEGVITFRATLRDDVLDRVDVGTILTQSSNQGVALAITAGNGDIFSDSVAIEVLAAPIVVQDTPPTPEPVQQVDVPTVVRETPRSGGLSTAIFIIVGAGVVGASTYFATRQQRMKVD
jgi:hypothetical protein